MIDNENLRSGECRCEEIFPELSAYIDGELDVISSSRVKEHLEKCEKCRKLLSELSDLSADIGSASIPYPRDLHSRLMGALKEEMAKERKKSKISDLGKAMKKHGMWIGAGVAAVICLALVGSPVFRGNFEFAMNDSKKMAIEEDAIMPQNGGVEAAFEMGRTNVYCTADEEELQAEKIEFFTSNSLSDKVETPRAEGQKNNSDKADDMTGTVSETETKEKDPACGETEYSFIPSFMLPRGELGVAKTELTH